MNDSIKKIIFIVFIFSAFLSHTNAPASSAKLSHTILYFFSADCPHCKQVTPLISELSKVYHVQGLFYGKNSPGPLPFPVRKGTSEEKDRYGIKGVPVAVILKEGKTIQILRGSHKISGIRVFLQAFEKDAMTVTEASERAPRGDVIIVGWITSVGNYFDKKAKFFLTDQQKNIAVKPWLPLEAVKAPMRKTRPRLMSDVIDKVVVLEGTLTRSGSDIQFIVGREISID